MSHRHRGYTRKFPESSVHENTNFEWSTALVHREWCCDCQICIDEISEKVYREDKQAFKERAHRGELLGRDVDREPVSHDVNRGHVQSIMRTLTALVSAHLSHLTADQTTGTSNLGILLDDAITTVVLDLFRRRLHRCRTSHVGRANKGGREWSRR